MGASSRGARLLQSHTARLLAEGHETVVEVPAEHVLSALATIGADSGMPTCHTCGERFSAAWLCACDLASVCNGCDSLAACDEFGYCVECRAEQGR